MLAALGEQLDALLDVTIVYPGDKAPGFWDLLSGAVPKVIIDIQVHELDPALWDGDYENDPLLRQTVQDWVNQLWRDKDQRIEALRAELAPAIAD
ncbi:putative acyltransferase YihG [compost metagenome]